MSSLLSMSQQNNDIYCSIPVVPVTLTKQGKKTYIQTPSLFSQFLTLYLSTGNLDTTLAWQAASIQNVKPIFLFPGSYGSNTVLGCHESLENKPAILP
jgi:hypothetical protein